MNTSTYGVYICQPEVHQKMSHHTNTVTITKLRQYQTNISGFYYEPVPKH